MAETPEQPQAPSGSAEQASEKPAATKRPASKRPAASRAGGAEASAAPSGKTAPKPVSRPARKPARSTGTAAGTSVVPKTAARPPASRPAGRAVKAPVRASGPAAVAVKGLTKLFAGRAVVDAIDLEVPAGSFYGFVGPNGAGKTTTLAMVTGMLRPDSGEVLLGGVDVWRNPSAAKRNLGVLPDRLRLFDRLTGVEFLHHAGALRGLDRDLVISRIADLAVAFGIEHSLDRFVADYSAGMVKKVAIAAAMIHSPKVLVLDEPFESVDPVSSAVITRILEDFVEAGGTVLLSSHSMELIERVCDSVAIIVDGRLLASGPMAEIVDGSTLERRFVELAGGSAAVQGMEWLQSFSE